MPAESDDVSLNKAGRIGSEVARDMIAMTGFRNVTVHEHQALDLGVLRAIVEDRWSSLVRYRGELGLRSEPKPKNSRN